MHHGSTAGWRRGGAAAGHLTVTKAYIGISGQRWIGGGDEGRGAREGKGRAGRCSGGEAERQSRRSGVALQSHYYCRSKAYSRVLNDKPTTRGARMQIASLVCVYK